MTARRLVVLLGFLLGTLYGMPGRPALGKNLPPPPNVLLQRGEAALKAGDLATAEQALTAAYRQTPQADLLFQLGQLAAAQGQLLAAQDLMRRYVNDPAATPDPVKVAAAQSVLAQPRPPSGKVRVQGDRGGLVLLDGRLLGRLPLVQPLLAAPGPRTLAIQYPGKLLDVPIQVVAGRMIDIQCTRATGAIFLNMLPALLLLPELPELPPATSEQLWDAVERAAQGEQLTILKPESLLTLVAELRSLAEPAALLKLKHCLAQTGCLQQLMAEAKLDYALRIRATAAPGWEFSTALLHVSTVGVASAQTQACASCSDPQAAAALQAAVTRTLAVGMARPRGTLTVRSDPAGAQVWLGDQLLGQTPLSLPTWEGQYTLELRQPGRLAVPRTIDVKASQTAEVAAELPLPVTAPAPSPPALPAPVVTPPLPPLPPRWERAPRPRWRLTLGSALLYAGATTAIGGAATIADSLPQPTLQLPMSLGCGMGLRYDQCNIGVGLTAAGGALCLTSVIVLAWPGARQRVP